MFSGEGGLHSVPFPGYIAPAGAETRKRKRIERMMNKTMVMKKDRRKRDIKSKLLAAIAMLMVSCIMVVSSTYAWFTLSTAPEVTGISTAIGANGNLELALLPGLGSTDTAYATVADALAAIGDASGNMTAFEKNTTWGNLVDLEDERYGLNQISLFPSQLAAEGNQLSTYYLGTPVYGSDGRFIEVGKSASAAMYHNGAFGTNAFGVRAIGTSSGLSAMELAYREALSTANDSFNKAITQTKNSAAVGGSALASVGVKKANEGDAAVYTEKDITSLITAYDAMDTALDNIEIALKQYIIAYALGNRGWNENNYTTYLDTMKKASLEDMKTWASDTLDGYIDTLMGMQTTVGNTLESLKTLPSNGTTTEIDDKGTTETRDDVSVELKTYAWSSFSGYLTALADIDKMLLNGHEINYYIKGNMANVNELINNMQNLVLEVNAAGGADNGLYVQMANFVDDFTTPVAIKNIKYGKLNLTAGLTATMKVYSSADPAYLPAAKSAAAEYPQNAFGTGGGSNISDFFGYIIDMAFRTNAAGSSLQLQTDAVDRIYDENSSTDTMGGGSSMTFGYDSSNDFTEAGLKKLMGYIRVVFFDPSTLTILGEARLNAATATTVTAEDGAVEITMDLEMWDPTLNDNKGGWAASSAITALQQNTATAVSTLVYLDGEDLTNADVANVDLTGTMNIQFSSDAELKPMEYGDLQNGNSEYKASVTYKGVELESKTVAKGASYSCNLNDFADKIGADLTKYDITVTMGGLPVAYDPANGNLTISEVTGNIVVAVTDKTP